MNILDGVKRISTDLEIISQKTELLSYVTACQSTLTINDHSITKFETNEMVNQILEIQFKIPLNLLSIKEKNENGIGCSASNNGYEKSLDIQKETYVDKQIIFSGIDHIQSKR